MLSKRLGREACAETDHPGHGFGLSDPKKSTF